MFYILYLAIVVVRPMPKVQGTTIATTAQKLTPPHTVLKMKQKTRNSSSFAIIVLMLS